MSILFALFILKIVLAVILGKSIVIDICCAIVYAICIVLSLCLKSSKTNSQNVETVMFTDSDFPDVDIIDVDYREIEDES